MRYRLRLVLAFLASSLVLAGCAGVQRATVGAPMVAGVANVNADADPAAAEPPDTPGATLNALVRAEGSSIQVTSGTLLASFDSQIRRFRGRLMFDASDPRRGRIVIDLDLTSFENPSRMVTAILQYEFLEIDAYPRARLDATFEPTGRASDEANVRRVTGTLELHGVRRAIAFEARVVRERDAYRFTTTFDLARRPFGIRQHDQWDWLNRDDVRVRIDLYGTPEHVTVEDPVAAVNERLQGPGPSPIFRRACVFPGFD